MSDQNRYDEFHQNVEEFWPYNGKLKTKKISVKFRSKTTEFVKAISAAATVTVIVAALLTLYVICSPGNIQPHSADINVQVYEWGDETIHYVLQKVDGEQLVPTEEGVLQKDSQTLRFTNLQENHLYRLDFFTYQPDGKSIKVGQYEFTTGIADEPVLTPTIVTLSGRVALSGRAMNADEFSFLLTQNGQPVQTATNDAVGGFSFALPFDGVGTYTYTLQQAIGTLPGITYDNNAFEFTVAVTNENGQLQAHVTAPEIHFSNTYLSAPGEVTIAGLVSLTGRPMNAGEFTILLDQNGQTVQTAANDISGNFTFKLTFEEAGTYTYTLKQVTGTAPAVTYDTGVYEATIEVTDIGGQLQARITTPEIRFSNTYVTSPGEATIAGLISLTGRPMNAGEFTILLAQNGQTVQTVTNDAGGSFGFTLPFNSVGTYTYTVRQVVGTAPGVTYDDKAFELTIAVTDEDGQLQAQLTASEIRFSNTYVSAPGEVTVTGQVSLTGRAMNAGEFTVNLIQNGQPVQTATNDGSGSFGFTLLFDAVGTYTYTVRQATGTAPGVTYDKSTFAITVVVTDEDGQLQARITTPEIRFSNTYVPAPAKVTINGQVSLTGRAMKAGEFTVTLIQNGKTVQTATNNGSGNFTFNLTFEEAGTYTYTVRQTVGKTPGVTYDKSTFEATVVVTDVNGQLQAQVTAQKIRFSNTYVPAPVKVTVNGKVSLTGRTMKAGEFTVNLIQNGQIVQTAVNDISGNFTFNLTFDKAGTYTYSFRQVKGTAPAVTYDTGAYDVTVEVTDIGGQLKATVNARNTKISNTYTPATVSATFSGSVRLSGRNLLANEFTFAVANGNQTLQTASNSADGGFTFDLTFTAAGTYTYKVYQVVGRDAQITYDTNIVTVTYTVTDNNGVLSVNGNPSRATFTNIHTPAPIVINIDGSVVLDGATLTAGQFTFILREGNTELAQTTNAANGSIRFTQTLAAAGTYVYTITQQEISAAEMGLRQDLDTLKVVVTVTDQNGLLTAAQEYSRQDKPIYTLEFWNVYEDLAATATIYGAVYLNNANDGSIMDPVQGRFRFGLYQDGRLVDEIGNDSDGYFYFPDLVFRRVGTYNYTVRQIPGSESRIQYDAREYRVVITVTFEYGDPMAVMDMYDSSGQYMQMLAFTNNYIPSTQTYTFMIPNPPGDGYAIYVYDETGMQSGSATALPGTVVEFYVMVPIAPTEINLQASCNIPGVIVEQVYRYGNEIRFQFVMPEQDVNPGDIILTVV